MFQSLKKVVGLSILLFGVAPSLCSQSDSLMVEAKIWSRDAKRKIQYSDWKQFPSYTIEQLNGFAPGKAPMLDKYGGLVTVNYPVMGFYYVHMDAQSGRSWLISPVGHPLLAIGMTSTRTGKSDRNEKSLRKRYGSADKWAIETRELLYLSGYNMTGSWSDWELFRAYNSRNPAQPMAYCTQLNLLSGFAQLRKKESSLKEYPELARVFDPAFSSYCLKKLMEFNAVFTDPHLVGHFTDNELSFQSDLLSDFIALNDPSDPAYVFAMQWIRENGIDTSKIKRSQSEGFSGAIAARYYKITNEALKNLDPKHLNLGSRLHASAKNNPHVLAAAEANVDLISINYYGNWAPTDKHLEQWGQLKKPYFITEFYTKGEDTGMPNISGAGWLVRTQADRGVHYQNFCLRLLQQPNCIGWHWFRYQDNDPSDKTADPSNNDSNKGIITATYELHAPLLDAMRRLNTRIYDLIRHFEKPIK
jgi:hypothetical protein